MGRFKAIALEPQSFVAAHAVGALLGGARRDALLAPGTQRSRVTPQHCGSLRAIGDLSGTEFVRLELLGRWPSLMNPSELHPCFLRLET